MTWDNENRQVDALNRIADAFDRVATILEKFDPIWLSAILDDRD